MTPRFDLTSLGETMLRLSVPPGHRLESMKSLDVHVGGAESNVCAALASLGRRCGWVSRLPDNPLGRLVLYRLRAARIDTSAVTLVEGTRVGTYYLEFSGPPRGAQVIYDRANSAATLMTSATIDWDYLLDARVLHLSGITPALGDACREVVGEAIGRAKSRGVLVSFDVNYRGKLWPPESAAAVIGELMKDVDLLLCSASDAKVLFGCDGDEERVLAGLKRLTAARYLVLTLGDRGVAALDGDRVLYQEALSVEIIDRPGAGDALAAGVIDGLLDGSLHQGLRRGVALAALALSQLGDIVLTSRQEVETILASEAVRISR